ncbi:MAG: EamA family transporter [Alphaproteobacteria bacterium]|nr:EamA family transporter [Alphaproteobacteria bacterium]
MRLSPFLILLGGIALLSAMDATIKFASETNHTLIVTLGRYVFGAVFAFAIWTRAGSPAITLDMWRAHALRGLVIAISAVTFFWSLTVLPFAEAVAYSFVYPLLVPFAAAAIVGEPVRATSFAAIALGFAGVLIATRGAPSFEQDPRHALGIAAVIVSATTFAVAVALMRARARTDGAPIVGLLATLLPGLIVLGPTLAFAPPPRWADWPVFMLMGALGASGMYLVARAYAAAEAQRLAPVHYTELLWASILGYVVFRETPRPEIFAGAAVIMAACLWSAWQARRIVAPMENHP